MSEQEQKQANKVVYPKATNDLPKDAFVLIKEGKIIGDDEKQKMKSIKNNG